MAYTLTQARKLLTAGELSVFESSRAQPIRGLTPARLRSKLERSRKLRDKYRDLYRRQSVATRAAPARKRSPVGADNQRTRQKAELFAEVLTRYETELKRVDAAASSAAKKAAKAAKAAKTGRATKAAKGTKATKPETRARSGAATKRTSGTTTKRTSGATAKRTSDATTKRSPKPATKRATKRTSGRAAKADAVRGPGTARADAEAKPRRRISLKSAVADALALKQEAQAQEAGAVDTRSAKAPARKRGARIPVATAPLDVTPETKRQNPLRKGSGNQAIHAHQRSQQRRVQARRDSR